MRKVWVIAAREYNAAVRTKAFVIGLLIMPVLMCGSFIAQKLLGNLHDVATQKFAVIDRNGNVALIEALRHKVDERNANVNDPVSGKQVRPKFELELLPSLETDSKEAIDSLRERLSSRVRQGELIGILEIGAAVDEPTPTRPGADPSDDRCALRYQTNRPTQQDFPKLAEITISEVIQAQRAARADLNLARVKTAMTPVPLVSKGLSWRNPKTGEVEDDKDASRFATLFVPGALMVLMYMLILMGATPLMQSVVEEKMNRVAEVLLGSARPFQLMVGKLLGMTGVSLTMSAVYLAGAWWAAHRYGFAEYVGLDLLAWFIAFQALASLMYGSLFIAVGAACTDLKETQTLMWPVLVLAMLPMFVLGNVLQEPNGPAATGMSFFPFATPTLMVARMAVPPGAPWWHPPVGVGLVLLTTLVCIYAAGRIFRVGLLLQGKGADFGQMLRWVVRG